MTDAPRRPKLSDIPDLDLLRAVDAFHGGAPTPDVAFAGRWPAKLVLAKLDRYADRGWVDYGVSLRTCRLTDEGRAALNAMEAAAGLPLSPPPPLMPVFVPAPQPGGVPEDLCLSGLIAVWVRMTDDAALDGTGDNPPQGVLYHADAFDEVVREVFAR